MHKQSVLLLFTLALAGSLNAQEIAGEWNGTLSAGGTQLRLALHITKAADGSLAGTMDSLDQGANGIPLSSISVKESQVSFTVDAVHGSYTGKLNADGSGMDGAWTQGQSMPLEFKRGAVAKVEHKPAKPTDIDGQWQGTLDTGSAKLRLVFHINNTEDGLIATLDSPDQGVNGMPVTNVSRHGDSLSLEMKQIGGAFNGVIEKNADTVNGAWAQGGRSMPLVLHREKDKR